MKSRVLAALLTVDIQSIPSQLLELPLLAFVEALAGRRRAMYFQRMLQQWQVFLKGKCKLSKASTRPFDDLPLLVFTPQGALCGEICLDADRSLPIPMVLFLTLAAFLLVFVMSFTIFFASSCLGVRGEVERR